MENIRQELVNAALTSVYALTDFSTHVDIDEIFECRRQTIIMDGTLPKGEKLETIRLLTEDYDYDKVLYNEGRKRTCESCKRECLATLYCEHCIRSFLKDHVSDRTSGNNDIDNLIKKCQMEAKTPNSIIEWIPYKD